MNKGIGGIIADYGKDNSFTRIAPTGCGQTWGQECTQIGKNDLSEPFWGIRVHCCDASCDASRVGWHECPNHHGAPAALPRWPPPPWSEKQALHERSRC